MISVYTALNQVVPQTKLSDPELKDEQEECKKSLQQSGVTLSALSKMLKLLRASIFKWCFFLLSGQWRFEFVPWSPPRFPVPLMGLCGVFLASLTLLVCSLLVVINKVCLVLGAGHILQGECYFLAISFIVESVISFCWVDWKDK